MSSATHFTLVPGGPAVCGTKPKSNRRATAFPDSVSCERCLESGAFFMRVNAYCRCGYRYHDHIEGKCPFAPTQFERPL